MTAGHPLPDNLASPAKRALAGAGYTTLEQLSKVTENELQHLHGVGPKAMRQLNEALAENGMSFATRARNETPARANR